jgi:hypothetical protein
MRHSAHDSPQRTSLSGWPTMPPTSSSSHESPGFRSPGFREFTHLIPTPGLENVRPKRYVRGIPFCLLLFPPERQPTGASHPQSMVDNSDHHGDPHTGILVGNRPRTVECEQRCVSTPLMDSAKAQVLNANHSTGFSVPERNVFQIASNKYLSAQFLTVSSWARDYLLSVQL